MILILIALCFRGNVYSLAERRGQEAFESEFLNTLIHEAVHQAQFNLDDG